MTQSLRYAPSSTAAAPTISRKSNRHYDWVAGFFDLPNPTAALGSVVIIAAGLYILISERAISAHSAMPILPSGQISAAE